MPKKNSGKRSSVPKKQIKKNISAVRKKTAKKKKRPLTTKNSLTRINSRGLKVLTTETKKNFRRQFHTPNEMLEGVIGGCWAKMSWSEAFSMIDGNMNMVLH